jgi:hypothetical protein
MSMGQFCPFSTSIVRIGLGLGISTNVVGAVDQHQEAALVRLAIASELGARWRRGGLR